MSLKSVKTLTASQIAKKWKLSQKTVNSLIDDGSKVEHEHDKDMNNAREIARDHISERPDYYKKLRKMEKSKISMKEGLSTEPERDSKTIGDYTGSSRKVMKVDEINLPKIPEKVKAKTKKAVAVGMTAANIATGADIYDRASRGVGSPVRDVAAAASGLPGKIGYGAMGANWTVKGFDKAREHIKSKQRAKMEEQGSPANPARYTERPIYEEDYDQDRVLAAFRKNETGSYEGNYGAKGRPGRSASGAYQYIDKTWRAVTKTLGIGSQYAHASDAPKEVQDAVKAGELKKAGSLQKAVNIHYTGNPEGKMSAKQLRANKGQTASTYYSNFQKNMSGYTPASKAPVSSTSEPAKAPEPVKTTAPTVKPTSNFKVSSASSTDTTSSSTTPKTPSTSVTPSTPSSSTTCGSYSVQKGDTLSGIAKRYHTDAGTLAKSSNISDPNKISPGQSINVGSTSSSATPSSDEKRSKTPTQVNEISAELVGKVSNARFRQGKAPSKILSRAINKKFVESGKKKEEIKKAVKEAVMAMPPQIQPPAIHGSQRAGVLRQVTKPTSVSGRASGRLAGQGGSMSGQVQVQRAAPPRAPTYSMPSGQRGSMSASPTKVSSSYSQGGANVGKGMAASRQTSPIVKGMTTAGNQAAAAITKAAPMASKVAGAALRVAGGPAATAAAAVMSPTPAGAGEDEKKRQETLKSYNPYKASGRSVSDYEKQTLTPQKYDTPKTAAPKVDAPIAPKRPEYFSRGQAFQAARGEAGGGEGKFSYDNKSYQTNVSGEKYKPESQLKQTSIKEETKMDTKDLINEALDDILENNLVSMKENLMTALQEKAMEKIEEKKREIAANYFAQ